MATTEGPGPDARRSDDVDVAGVVASGVWLAVATIAICAIVWGFFRLLTREENRSQKSLPPAVAANLRRTPPGPRLEAYPLLPRQRMRAEEDAVLNGYAWVDRGAGTVRIPIDLAMEIVAERGLPPSKPMSAASAGSASSALGPPNPNPYPLPDVVPPPFLGSAVGPAPTPSGAALPAPTSPKGGTP